MLYYICQVAKSETSTDENVLEVVPKIFAGDECITDYFHARQKRIGLSGIPRVFTQSTLPENGLEKKND